VAALFRSTVRTVNLRDYTPVQVAAWAHDGIDPARWAKILSACASFVAVDGDTVLGFTDVEPDGHLDHLYVHHAHQRQGIAAALHAAAEAEAWRNGAARLYTEASITARPFFLAQGYRVVHEETVVRQGVAFLRYAMQKPFSRT
jgi:putative acetyltransferase